jgi:hypothetical protein
MQMLICTSKQMFASVSAVSSAIAFVIGITNFRKVQVREVNSDIVSILGTSTPFPHPKKKKGKQTIGNNNPLYVLRGDLYGKQERLLISFKLL